LAESTVSALFTSNPAYFAFCLTLLGLVVGSFLNVVILRVPAMLERQWTRDCRQLLELETVSNDDSSESEHFSLVYPGSRCPSCGTDIKPWQNIPILSYLLLRGRCGSCKASIGIRYPLVEAFTAIATVTVGVYIPWGPSLLAYLLLTWSLIALAGIDIDTQLLPDNITMPLLWGGILFHLMTGTLPLENVVAGAIAGYLLLWSIYWIFKLITGKEGMGYGDFKLLAALGAWLGWQSIPLIILLSSAVGAVLGIIILALQGKDRSQPLPFGPYLAAAGWITLLWGEAISDQFFPGLL